MPIYEYRCRQCHHGFENIVLSRGKKVVCPKCESAAVEKQLSVFSAPALQSEKSVAGGGCGCTPQSCGCC